MKFIIFSVALLISISGFTQQQLFRADIINTSQKMVYYSFSNHWDSIAAGVKKKIEHTVENDDHWLYLVRRDSSVIRLFHIFNFDNTTRKLVINHDETVSFSSDEAEMLFEYFSTHQTKTNLLTLSDSLIKQNTDNIASAEIIKISLDRDDIAVDTIERFYNMLSIDAQNSKPGKDVLKYITARKFFTPGSSVKNFTLNDSAMKPVSLSDINSDYVLLDFWFSRCVPCIESFPALIDLYKKTNRNKLEIVGLSVDDKDHLDLWKDAINKHHLPWMNLSDVNFDIAYYTFSIQEYPTKVLLNKERKIVKINPSNEEVEAMID